MRKSPFFKKCTTCGKTTSREHANEHEGKCKACITIDRAIAKTNEPIQFEPIEYLRSLSNGDYRGSNWWKSLRLSFEARKKTDPCACCGQRERIFDRRGNQIETLPVLNIHHTTYANLGNEQEGDLVLVCNPCHNLIHFPDSQGARYWLARNSPEIAEKAQKLCPPGFCFRVSVRSLTSPNRSFGTFGSPDELIRGEGVPGLTKQ